MKRFLYLTIYLIIVSISSPLIAQEWNEGPQPVVYSTHQVGDGSTESGGTPPALATAPAEITTTGSTAGMITTGGPPPGLSTELKFRIWCGSSHENHQDAILAKGQEIGPHDHSYIGNRSTNKDSTYTTLRSNPESTCAGNKFFSQAYWEPSVCKNQNLQIQCLQPDNALFYYERPRSEIGKLTSLPQGTSFIMGKDRTDMGITRRLSELPAGYNKAYDGFLGWSCVVNATVTAKTVDDGYYYFSFETPQHTDPWEGRCVKGSVLQANFTAPPCWDGHNRTSPNGRDHFRYTIRPSNYDNEEVSICPDNWYRVPDLQARFRYSLKKNGEYFVDHWYLSSDRMDPDPANWFTPGSTAHADWMMAVDPDIWHTIMAKCLGIPSPGYTAVGGDCGTYGIGDGRILEYGSINTGPWRYNQPAKNRWWPLKAQTKWQGMMMNH